MKLLSEVKVSADYHLIELRNKIGHVVKNCDDDWVKVDLGPELGCWTMPAENVVEVTPTPSGVKDERKNTPVFSGVLQYFPDALAEIAKHSKKGSDKHNPGEPMRWAKDKSSDHADCVARHLMDIGPDWNLKDPETGSYHATALAWRALALLQILLEKERKLLDE